MKTKEKNNIQTLVQIARHTKPIKKYLRSYVDRYSELFENIRDKPLKILEIGIGGYKNPNKGGGSLRMWAEYFKNATIVGVDCNVKILDLPNNVKHGNSKRNKRIF